MTGKYYFPAHADADHKRSVVLELALLISDHLIKNGGKFGDVYFALKRYLWENMKYREEEDADIKEENKLMKMTHAVLAADMENERKGRVKPDTLSEEEHNEIMRYGFKAQMEKIKELYWLLIGILMAEGYTPEQAREKMYQDLLNVRAP
jgi:hypothetical protein